MKILMLAPQPFFAERGTPINVRMMAETLRKLGNEVDLLVYHEGRRVPVNGVRLVRMAAPPGIRNVPVGPSWKKLACDFWFAARFLELLRRERYDVIHAIEEAAYLAYVLRPVHRLPYIVDLDSSIPDQLEKAYPWIAPLIGPIRHLEKCTLRSSVATLAMCEELAEAARARGARGPVAVIEDAVLLEGSEERATRSPGGGAREKPTPRPFREEFGISAQVPIVLYVGNLQRYQGIDLLLEAFARTRAEAALVIVGGEEASVEGYRRRCRDLGISARTHWAGPRPLAQLGACLAQAQVLVSPRSEGVNTPLKIYSYLASGVATLATKIPAHTQVLTEEVAQLTEPTPEALARGLERLLGDGELRTRLGSRARALAEEKYSRRAFDAKLARFYRAVEERVTGPRRGEA